MSANARFVPILLLALAAAALPAPLLAQAANQITEVSPDSGVAGATELLVTFTLDADAPPAPPAGVLPESVTMGTLIGVSVTHSSQYIVSALFDLPAGEIPGLKDCTIVFNTPSGALTFFKNGGFTVLEAPESPPSITLQPRSQTVQVGESASFVVAASGTAPLSYQWQKDGVNLGGDGSSPIWAIPSVAAGDAGDYRCVVTNDYGAATSDAATLTVDRSVPLVKAAFPVVDTAQTNCYDDSTAVACPSPGQPFYGQDSQFPGYPPRFTKSADGLTVHDDVTGLTWQSTPDTDGDGLIGASDKMTWDQAQARPAALDSAAYGGYSDWRLPSIKELYSLIDFRGTDPSGLSGSDTTGLIPFIDRTCFDFAYGDTGAGERIIDSQYASSTLYAASDNKLFGVNFADGRIKGYDLTMPGGSVKTFLVQCARGNPGYGINALVDNGDGTVTDHATGLMWAKSDSGFAMSWEDALAWVQAENAADYLGYDDWRLPNAKELQSIVDYERSPDSSGSAAISPLFNVTSFTGEMCSTEYPWYWASTTHAQYNGSGATGVYVCFGRATGYMGAWVDIHGAGAQRSDPKGGSLSSYSYAACGYYNSIAPQGDSVRISNYVRLVRGGAGPLRTGFTFSPTLPTEGTPVTFSATAGGGTSPYLYGWDLGGTPATGPSPTKTFTPGSYTIVLTVTDAAGLVTSFTDAISVAPVASGWPPVADGKLGGVAATFSPDATLAGWIDVTYDAATCSGQNAVILYGNLGDFSTYQGCAAGDAGDAGTAIIDATSLGNVWFNIVWTGSSTAGHPGYGFDGTEDVERSWNAAGICGVTGDDHSHASCP